jgi:hypothetical protein
MLAHYQKFTGYFDAMKYFTTQCPECGGTLEFVQYKPTKYGPICRSIRCANCGWMKEGLSPWQIVLPVLIWAGAIVLAFILVLVSH